MNFASNISSRNLKRVAWAAGSDLSFTLCLFPSCSNRMCIRVGVEIPFKVFRGSGLETGNTLAVRGVSPQAVSSLAKSLQSGIRLMGNVSCRQRWLPATLSEYEEYLAEFGQAFVKKTPQNGTDEYRIMVLDIFDGNHRWHASLMLIKEGKLDVQKVFFQTNVYNELLPDVVAELTGTLLNEYVIFFSTFPPPPHAATHHTT